MPDEQTIQRERVRGRETNASETKTAFYFNDYRRNATQLQIDCGDSGNSC